MRWDDPKSETKLDLSVFVQASMFLLQGISTLSNPAKADFRRVRIAP